MLLRKYKFLKIPILKLFEFIIRKAEYHWTVVGVLCYELASQEETKRDEIRVVSVIFTNAAKIRKFELSLWIIKFIYKRLKISTT